ncbi:MAG: TRAP transporter substrate-binding protein [Beijerinckiaceae bacterium]|nr:TRAP transporter substrate-binding protein [Beijerinckiaceae bacterium]MDO9442788.1 TRAP transporter substrate-binding protein [Beijerinckiaceae bacterium]
MRTGTLLLTALLCAVSSVVSAQTFTIKVSSPTVNDVTHEWMKEFKTGVEARAGGKVKVEIYPANQLGQIPATVEGAAMGTIEVVAPASGFLIGLEPRFQVFDAPGLFNSMAAAQKVFADAEMRKRLSEYGGPKGLEPIAIWAHGPVMLLSHKAIRKVADFKGQKIRVPGAAPLQIEPFRKLGAAPLSMPLGEVLSAMQNRTIDGLVASATVFTAFKYFDLAKGLTALPGSFLVVPAMANKAFLKSLGPDLEKVVREEAFNAQRKVEAFAIQDADNTTKTWLKNGGELIAFDADETKKYLDQVTSALPAVLAANAKLKGDYEALAAASKAAN